MLTPFALLWRPSGPSTGRRARTAAGAGAWAIALLPTLSSMAAGPRFRECAIERKHDEALFADLDGDRLEDLVLVDGPELAVFFQDALRGFGPKSDQVHRLAGVPAVLWPARLDRPAESLFVMTHDGVSELTFADRTGPPKEKKLINQATILPARADGPAVFIRRLSARTAGPSPLILVPIGEDLQVWRLDGGAHCCQTIRGTVEGVTFGPIDGTGYTRSSALDVMVGPIGRDALDDLVVRTRQRDRVRYRVYRQGRDGSFGADPAADYTDANSENTWHGWTDFDRDGKVDLVRGRWLNEPWFLPVVRSGKVLVEVFLADASGRIPPEPTWVFRKNDWIPSLPLTDIDGDGCVDLVLGYGLFDSREGFRKTMVTRQLDHSLRIHFYRPGQGFPAESDCRRDVSVRVDERGMYLTISRRDYLGRSIDVTGDFDGDGRKDLLVDDAADHLSVYPFLSRREGFAKEASILFPRRGGFDGLIVTDLNADGISDLVLELPRKSGLKVFLSERR